MNRTARMLLASALAALAGGAAAAVTVGGTDVSAGSGPDWTYEAPAVRLTGPGPFVVSGTDETGGTVLRAEADCTVVASNLVLSAAGTGGRARGEGWTYARAVAEDGAGRSVAVFPGGIGHASVPTAVLAPDDPASAAGYVFAWSDVWKASDVLWTPHETNDAAVVWTGERFVAARRRGGFMFSGDGGATWNEAAWDGHPVNLRSVARDPASGMLVAASTEGLWRSSDGGLTWAQSTNLSSYAVVRSDGRFVAVGNSKGAPQGLFWSDDDGATWRARYFSDQNGALYILVAGGGDRFLAGSPSGWRALHLENGGLVCDGTASMSASKFAVAAGNGVYVACAGANTGLRRSADGVSWTRSDKQDGTFPSIVFRNGAFFAEGEDASGAYAGLWASQDGESWTRVADSAPGRPALDCGAHAVSLEIAGAGNALAGGFYAPAVRVASGGSVEVSAHGADPATLAAAGGRRAAAFGGGFGEDAGAFVQRGATLFAQGGAGAPDVGPGSEARILGGSLRPWNDWIDPAPSNGVEAVRCVVVDGLAPGEAAQLANLPAGYGTDGVAADENGCVYLWLPEAAQSFRFIAGGSLRRVAAGGGETVAETLPAPKVEGISFAPATRGALQVTLRVSSPVEAEALAPVYATDLSTLSSGGGDRLVPSRVGQIAEDEYELTFSLPADADSGFFSVHAQ